MAPSSIFRGVTLRFVGVTATVVLIGVGITRFHTGYTEHRQLLQSRIDILTLVRLHHFPHDFLTAFRRAMKLPAQQASDPFMEIANGFFIGRLPDIEHFSVLRPGASEPPVFAHGIALHPLTNAQIETLKRTDEVVTETLRRGSRLVVSHACPISASEKAPRTIAIMRLALSVPALPAFMLGREIRDLPLTLLWFVIATLISTFVIGYLTRSLRSVAAYAQAIEHGEIADQLAIRGHDEAGTIAAALNVVLQRLRDSYISTLGALAALLETKDYATETHSLRGVRYALELGRAAGLSQKQLTELEHGAMLHDIGKIGVADVILTKAGPLTEEEWDKIKAHPTIGFNVLRHLEFLRNSMPVILYHQERYDGRGYPKGLKGQDIPLLARVFTIADAFDAMTSDRPYRQAMPPEIALQEIMRNSGTQFDPKLVELFVKLYADGRLQEVDGDLAEEEEKQP